MKKITGRQAEVLNYIKGFIDQCCYSPSIREIADHFSMTVRGAQDHILALKRKGFIKSNGRKPRTITVLG